LKNKGKKLDLINIATAKIIAEMGGDMSLLTQDDVESLGGPAVTALTRLSKLNKRKQAAEAAMDDREITKIDNEIRSQQDVFRREGASRRYKIYGGSCSNR
jgi:hypothetical protein